MSSFSPFGVGQASTIAFSPPFQPFYPFAKPKRSLGPTIDHVADANARLSLTAEGMVVSGAGLTDADGIYTQRGIYHDKPFYNLTSSPTDTDADSITWGDSGSVRWKIKIDTAVQYYSEDDVPTPDLATWISGRSPDNDPAPTVTHSPGQVTGAGYQVIQDDDGLTYTFNGDGADADAGLWVTGAGTSDRNGAYIQGGGASFSQIGGINTCVSSLPSALPWQFNDSSRDYISLETPTYPWDVATWIKGADVSDPVPVVTRNPIASSNNWTP